VSVLVVGLSHRSAPVSLLERASLTRETQQKLLTDALDRPHVGEAAVLSTCNRIEVYADVEKFHGGVADVSELLARHTGLGLDELSAHLYVHYEDRAVQHLFTVASGLDSMVVGEGQILAQVRGSLRDAQEAGAAGRVLNELVQQALRVGKRAHAETGIDRAGASLVSVGLDLAGKALGGIEGRTALVVGAGSMSALAAASLRRAGVGRIVIANRTQAHAARVASAVDGEAHPLDALERALPEADIVISCTGATGYVMDAAQFEAAQAVRGGRPVFALDLALPRDIDPIANAVEGLTLVGIEDLGEVLRDHQTALDVEDARHIVADEVAAFVGAQRAAQVAPVVVALRSRAAEVVDAELDRLDSRLPGLDPVQRDEVARALRRTVEKLLHVPTVRMKELAADEGGHSYAEALHTLFDLDPHAIEAITQAAVPDPQGER
jgi:glutamyl-tRNA reductase